MDEMIRQCHAALIPRLRAGQGADRYATDALLVPPSGGGPIRGRAAIATFLDDGGFAGLQSEPLHAERMGASAYVVASYKQPLAAGGGPERVGTSISTYAEDHGDWRIVADIYGRQLVPNVLDEWKECRSSVDRFDRLIVDVRKYGFTLITGLLTAGSFLFAKADAVAVSDRAQVTATIVLMLLVFALFTVDRWLEVLLRVAVRRARDIEPPLGIRLTEVMSGVAERSHIATWATWLYTFFVVGALAFWFIPQSAVVSIVSTATSREPRWWAVRIGLWFIVAIWSYHYVTRAGVEDQKLWKVVWDDRRIAWMLIVLVAFVVGSTLCVWLCS